MSSIVKKRPVFNRGELINTESFLFVYYFDTELKSRDFWDSFSMNDKRFDFGIGLWFAKIAFFNLKFILK